MAKVAVLTFSDGRPNIHRDIEPFARDSERKLAATLQEWGHEVLCSQEIVASTECAVNEARRLDAWRPDLTIFHIPVWAFPHFSMLAADATSSPLLLFSNLDPQYPGMVGMLAAAGGLDQIGRICGRAWGEIEDSNVAAAVQGHVAAAHAVRALRGTTFGRIGGRPMGMYTATANTDQWLRTFGIDVEEIDQWELVRRSQHVPATRLKAARKWLESTTAAVHYDGIKLTPEILERQIASYYAMRELIDEWHLTFSGIKGQPELTDHFVTMDVTEAFLNDPYDWDGPKDTHVCATEADMDGALTMQILKLLAGTPVLFADLRHYHSELGIWDLCNSGEHATWFAARSDDPGENLRKVHLYPEVFYFPAGGASVHHLAAPGEMTFARLTRLNGVYRLQAFKGVFEQFDEETNLRLMRASTFEWPHAFARFEVSAETVLSRYASNHIHAIPGDHMTELRLVAKFLNIGVDEFGPHDG